MAQESSNVYSKIIDLSTYLDSVPGTTGFIPFVSNKGPDNKLIMVTGQKSLVDTFGDEDIIKFGKNFREGLMSAKNYAEIAGSLYCLRVLPENAQYSSILIYSDLVSGKQVLKWENVNSLTSENDLDTILLDSGDKKPMLLLHGKYRGEHYNNYWVNFTPIVNSDFDMMDIYTLNPRGNKTVIKSYQISLDETAVDPSGESTWIGHVLDFYDKILDSRASEANIGLIDTLESDVPVLERIAYADNPAGVTFVAGDLILVGTGAGAFVGEDGNIATADGSGAFTFAAPTSGDRYIINEDLRAVPADQDAVATFTSAWAFEAPVDGMVLSASVENIKLYFTGLLWEEYKGLPSIFSPANAVNDTTDEKGFAYGSDGDLIGVDGKIDNATAIDLLVNAYGGILEPDVFDEESYDFSVVFAPGYPRDVKDAAAQMVIFYRPDAVLFTDVGDVNSPNAAIEARQALAYNDYHIALYNNYTKIRHSVSGQNIWVSPTYHMSKIIPYNDNVASIWAAPANFRRAKLVGIKDIRYRPIQGDRDNLYMAQLNSVTKWRDGYTMWEVLTSQVRTSALSDIPVVRLVLYIEKALRDFCRFYLFEANTAVTWDAIQKEITVFLNKIKREGGLRDFQVDVGADAYELKTKRCHVNVILTPTRHIEKIDLNLFITN